MLLKLILVNCPNSTAFNTPSNAEMADKTRKTICKYIGTRVVLVICFESMHAIGHVGSQNRQI